MFIYKSTYFIEKSYFCKKHWERVNLKIAIFPPKKYKFHVFFEITLNVTFLEIALSNEKKYKYNTDCKIHN